MLRDMKSKSFESSKVANNVMKNKTYEFVKFYKSAAETNVQVQTVEKRNCDDGSSKENIASNKLHTPKRMPKKKKSKTQHESLEMSKINITGDSLSNAGGDSILDHSKVTSTPYAAKPNVELKVKSIIKKKSPLDRSLDVSNVSISSKPKKRNKSVSFMLDDTEEVAIKRSKSEQTVNKAEKKQGKSKKPKKILHDEKGNKDDTSNMIIVDVPIDVATTSKLNIISNTEPTQSSHSAGGIQTEEKPEKRKRNKLKKPKVEAESEHSNVVTNESEEPKIKKSKKKKRHIKSVGTDNIENEGEPVHKSSKKDIKTEKIAEDLENLNIGDNAHTLTNLLDEMTVVDKKKKKNKKIQDKGRKQKKDEALSTNSKENGAQEKNKTNRGKERKLKKDKTLNASSDASETKDKNKEENKKQMTDKSNASVESTDIGGEGTEEKEKVKWIKRKWNKDKKGAANVDKHLTSVIIENLPIALMFTYRKLLTEHFEKFGMIRQVGVAELYPTEEPKPKFTTTINFYSEDAAEKALEEDNTLFEGARVRVKRPLPPSLTTLVVRSYAELTEQALSSVFSGAGRIRTIRHVVKGRKSSSTSFIEFDGPKSVERAIKIAEDAKIGGKKIHVAKFEICASNKTTQHNNQEDSEGDHSNN